MSRRALVFLFDSDRELSPVAVHRVAFQLAQEIPCHVSDLVVKQLDENDIAMGNFVNVVAPDGTNVTNLKLEALRFFASEFANDLIGAKKDVIRFSTDFATKVTVAKLTGTETRYLHCLSALKDSEYNSFPRTEMIRLGITPTVFGIIKNIAIHVQDLAGCCAQQSTTS